MIDIDDETFVRERDALREKIAKAKAQLCETENRAERWLELTEKTFNLVTYAQIAFEKGSLEQKREILTALGSNFTIKDKKLNITNNFWLVPIEKAYPELEAEYRRIELDKTLTITERNAALTAIRSRWGALVKEVRTCLAG